MDNNYLRILYRINSRDEIVFVNDEWSRFALANGAAELLPDKILNQSVWNFITDDTTEFLYREIFKKVRRGKVIEFDIRCDSPAMRCLSAVTVASPNGDGEIQIATRTLWTKRRASPINFDDADSSAAAQPRQPMLIVCSWCKKINVGAEVWEEVEAAIKTLGLFELELLPPQSHGICSVCYREITEKLQKPPTE